MRKTANERTLALVIPSESRVSRSETTEVDGKGDWNMVWVEKTMVDVEISLNILRSLR